MMAFLYLLVYPFPVCWIPLPVATKVYCACSHGVSSPTVVILGYTRIKVKFSMLLVRCHVNSNRSVCAHYGRWQCNILFNSHQRGSYFVRSANIPRSCHSAVEG